MAKQIGDRPRHGIATHSTKSLKVCQPIENAIQYQIPLQHRTLRRCTVPLLIGRLHFQHRPPRQHCLVIMAGRASIKLPHRVRHGLEKRQTRHNDLKPKCKPARHHPEYFHNQLQSKPQYTSTFASQLHFLMINICSRGCPSKWVRLLVLIMPPKRCSPTVWPATFVIILLIVNVWFC